MSICESSILPFRGDQKKTLLRTAAKKGQFQLWRMKLALQASLQSSSFSGCGHERVLVRPASILHDATGLWMSNSREVQGGDWDHRAKQSSIHGPLVACSHQHFVEGRPWCETDEFQSLSRQLVQGAKASGDSRPDLLRCLTDVDDLASRVARTRAGQPIAGDGWPDVSLGVARDGTLAALDNVAAVAVAQALGVEQIPGRVAVRHAQWIKFCKEYLYFGQRVSGGQPYQPSTHIDLAGLVCSWSERRFEIIQECLRQSHGKLMDIGANLGYFCHRAEELGYDCVAVEACPRLAYFTEKLKQAENRRFHVLCDSVLEHSFAEPYDVVLALNIFHHFLKTAERYRQFVAMLGRMRVREMIFQSHRPQESQMRAAYRDYLPDDFVQFIMDHSCLKTAEYLGSDRDRRIYRLRVA